MFEKQMLKIKTLKFINWSLSTNLWFTFLRPVLLGSAFRGGPGETGRGTGEQLLRNPSGLCFFFIRMQQWPWRSLPDLPSYLEMWMRAWCGPVRASGKSGSQCGVGCCTERHSSCLLLYLAELNALFFRVKNKQIHNNVKNISHQCYFIL